MKIVFLASTRRDLEWFRQYYETTFREGAAGAREHFKKALANLRSNPHIGHISDEPGNRELAIPRTPFLLTYSIVKGRIEILRIRDGRANPLPAKD